MRIHPILSKLLAALLFALVLAFAGSRLGNLHWFGDYLALFHDWYFILAVSLLGLFIAVKQWRMSALTLVLVLSNGALLAPYYLPQPTTLRAPPDASLRLLVYNVYAHNQTPASIIDEIRQHDPNVVFLMEYSDGIQLQIEAALDDYPYRVIDTSRYTMGLALFSRLPLENTMIHQRPETTIPIFEADIVFNGQLINFVGGHPLPPRPRWANLQRAQTADIAAIAIQAGHPLIVAGDFNASQWSSTVRGLSMRADVRDAHLGRGVIKTWQHRWLKLPLDHVLVSAEIQVANYQLGTPSGSDHTPLIVDIVLP